MKKVFRTGFKALAVLASAFLMFNTVACSSDDDDDDESKSGPTAEKPVFVTNSGTLVYSGDDINAAWAKIGASGDYEIRLAKGITYSVAEGTQLSYKGAANIKISGETTTAYGADVVIKGNPKTNSQKNRELIYLPSGSTGNLILENVSVINEYTADGDAQAEALATDGTGKLAAYNCSFLSHQDTIRTIGKAWFYKCYIEGDTDFLWMESSGSVALYEECVIKAVAGRQKSGKQVDAYITAPRMNVATKGLVIYNSEIKVDDGITTYAARTPWSSGYYNQVAYINNSGSGVSAPKSAKNWGTDKDKECLTADGISQSKIGWKIDARTATAFGWDVSSSPDYLVSADDVTNEFSGRRAIFNRVYNTKYNVYQEDDEAKWDIDSVISANKWKVTADSSKSKLDSDVEYTTKIYDFSAENVGAWTDNSITIDGFSHHSSNTATGVAGKTISFDVTGKGTITVVGCYSGYGIIKFGGQGSEVYDFNTSSTSKFVEKNYVNYTGAGKVTIEAGTTSYIQKIIVEYYDSLTYKAVSGIEVKEDRKSVV